MLPKYEELIKKEIREIYEMLKKTKKDEDIAWLNYRLSRLFKYINN